MRGWRTAAGSLGRQVGPGRQTDRQADRWTDGAGDIVIDRTEIYTEI